VPICSLDYLMLIQTKTVNHVTYNITSSKDVITAKDEKIILSDLFHAHKSTLTLKVEPANGSLSINGIESSANIKFSDKFSEESLDGDIIFDLKVIGNGGTEVIKKEGLTAKNSQDTLSLIFPVLGEYQVALGITRLQIPSGQLRGDSLSIDLTRNGIARASVQVK
jgi:hypothetical protein